MVHSSQSPQAQWPTNKAGFPMRPQPAIAKAAGAHRWAKGGKGNKPLDKRFVGECCGGDRKVGDWSRAKCKCCPAAQAVSAYLCQNCRTPLALTEEQRTRVKNNAANAQEIKLDGPLLKIVAQAEEQYLAQREAK